VKKLYFYFDVVSPYAYLASTRITEIAEKYGCELQSEPVLLAGILQTHGQKGPAEIPSKRSHLIKDILRCAAEMDVPLVGPPTHPFNPLLALRSVLAVTENTERNKLAAALLMAVWGLGKDVADPKVILDVIQGLGMNGAEILERAQSDNVKMALRKNTEQAIAKGVFGVPTFVIDEELFWGNDRLDFLSDYLSGSDPLDKQKVQNILSRPSSAERTAKR